MLLVARRDLMESSARLCAAISLQIKIVKRKDRVGKKRRRKIKYVSLKAIFQVQDICGEKQLSAWCFIQKNF
jgi:hypothetical protein